MAKMYPSVCFRYLFVSDVGDLSYMQILRTEEIALNLHFHFPKEERKVLLKLSSERGHTIWLTIGYENWPTPSLKMFEKLSTHQARELEVGLQKK